MYIVRNSHDLKTTHAFTESKPCKNCLNMLMKFGIRKIVYSQFDGTIVKKKVNRLKTEHLSKAFTYLQKEKVIQV